MEYKKIFLLGIFKAFSTCSKTQFLKTKVFLNSILNGAQPCWKHMQRVSSESYIWLMSWPSSCTALSLSPGHNLDPSVRMWFAQDLAAWFDTYCNSRLLSWTAPWVLDMIRQMSGAQTGPHIPLIFFTHPSLLHFARINGATSFKP